MALLTTFYFSRILGNKIYDGNGGIIGKLKDIIVEPKGERPKVIAVSIATKYGVKTVDFSYFTIEKNNNKYKITCKELKEISIERKVEPIK